MSTKLQKSRLATQQHGVPPLVIDLCCGMGGISLAAQQLKMRVLAGVDVDPAASRTYRHNFADASALTGSVRSKLIIDECRKLIEAERNDQQKVVVVSGPPCQGFSIAGPRNPNDPRNQILIAVARFIVAIKPHCAMLENVSRVLGENHEERIKKLTGVLQDVGYQVSEVILDAADFGVPQRRKRAFFMITKRVVDPKILMQLFESLKKSPVNVGDALADLPTPAIRPDRYIDVEDSDVLSNHYAMQHSEKVKAKIAAIPQGTGPMSYRRLHPKRASNTLISGHRAPPAHYSQPRSITVREAMRLQGFPDRFRVYGPFGTQMGQVTNAVPPPLAKAALEVLCQIAEIDEYDKIES